MGGGNSTQGKEIKYYGFEKSHVQNCVGWMNHCCRGKEGDKAVAMIQDIGNSNLLQNFTTGGQFSKVQLNLCFF